jgi:mannose-6-phosphate isomerase-like protein (cupin superfamily)
MICRGKGLASMPSPNMRGGEGTGQVQAYFSPESFSTGLAAFNVMSLEPEVSIGEHKHVGSEELYWVLEGRAEVTDDGMPSLLEPGDALLTRDGHSHSLRNPGPGTLRFLAVLVQSNIP